MAAIAGVSELKRHPDTGKPLDWARGVLLIISVLLVVPLLGLLMLKATSLTPRSSEPAAPAADSER